VRTIGGLSLNQRQPDDALRAGPRRQPTACSSPARPEFRGVQRQLARARFDAQNNDLLVHNGVLATSANQLKMGFNAAGGYWNGAAGILSAARRDRFHPPDHPRLSQPAALPLAGVATVASDVL